VRFFDRSMLAVLKWVSDRYLAPLATVIDRSHPPRVAGEERRVRTEAPQPKRGASASRVLERYGGDQILSARRPVWLRPLPDDEAPVCVDAVERTLAGDGTALVLVPEAEPLSATARRLLERFDERAAAFVGGDARERYRTWLEIQAGRFDVVVATRPGVFAPLPRLGLIWICRDAHPAHREERAPYYHVRDVALARAGLQGAACVLASISPSVEVAVAAASSDTGRSMRTARPPRSEERLAAPLVETVPPEAEDRSARLGTLLRQARSAVLLVSRRGYGVARVCRSCGEPAACATCGGTIGVAGGHATCIACRSPGRCARCGGTSFGIERGGTERLAEWAQDLERLGTDLSAAIERLEERQREQLEEVHRRVRQEIEEIALETREHKATVLRFRDEAQRVAKEAIDAATSDLEDVAAQRRQALQEVSDRLGARERELLKRIDREEAEATARMEVKFADVERRQIERLQRSLEHEASRLLEDASREFHKTIRVAQEETARRLARELERAVTDLSSQGERLLRQRT